MRNPELAATPKPVPAIHLNGVMKHVVGRRLGRCPESAPVPQQYGQYPATPCIAFCTPKTTRSVAYKSENKGVLYVEKSTSPTHERSCPDRLGYFAYNAHSSAGAQQELRVQVADLIATQERLIADDQRTADDLNATRDALSNLRASSERTATERDEVRAQLSAAREEMTALEKRLEVQPRQTGSVRSAAPPARTAPPPPTRMSGDRVKPSL